MSGVEPRPRRFTRSFGWGLSEYRKEFIRDLLGKSYSPREVVNRVRVMQALCDGKTRLVTVPSATQQLLSPLHDTLYEYLGTLPWLLVGEAKPSCFSGFARKTKEVFVSGDYESATDNLKLDVARHILQCVLRRFRVSRSGFEMRPLVLYNVRLWIPIVARFGSSVGS